MNDTKPKTGLLQAFFTVLKGALIGAGAILPGISGGVLCVTMGIYKPIIALLSNPIRRMREDWRFYLPIVIGFAVGILGLSRLVDVLFRASPTPAVWLFIGLIAGSMPSLFQEAGQEGRGKGSWIALCLGLAFSLGLFFLLRSNIGEQVTPNVFWWLLCGALWGVGIVVPGMSPSSIFIFLGLYQPMSAGIADLNFAILLPLAAGLAASALGLARGMRLLLKRAYSVAMHLVVGVTIASTIVIIPIEQAGIGDIAIYALCFAVGGAIALWMGKMSKSTERA